MAAKTGGAIVPGLKLEHSTTNTRVSNAMKRIWRHDMVRKGFTAQYETTNRFPSIDNCVKVGETMDFVGIVYP